MSSNTKEGSLVSAVLLYAIRCIAEGDMLALQHMQFGKKEIDALRELSLQDLYRADTLKAHCLSISLNRQVFWPLVDALKRERKSDDQLNELIEQDAPFEMLNRLFGIASREYANRRRHLPATLGQGRPSLPESAAEDKLFDAWQDCIEKRQSTDLYAQDYLELHDKTQVSHRAIWQLTQHWAEEDRQYH